MIDVTKPEVKEYFSALWGILSNPEALQDIFDWLIARDISQFDPDIIPASDFKEEMAADSLSYVQKYMIEVCNSARSVEFIKGVGKVTDSDLFSDYRVWCLNDIGLADKFVLDKLKFRKEIATKMDIEHKKVKIGGKTVLGHRIVLTEVEMAMRKMLKNQAWVLLKEDGDDTDSELDDQE